MNIIYRINNYKISQIITNKMILLNTSYYIIIIFVLKKIFEVYNQLFEYIKDFYKYLDIFNSNINFINIQNSFIKAISIIYLLLLYLLYF